MLNIVSVGQFIDSLNANTAINYHDAKTVCMIYSMLEDSFSTKYNRDFHIMMESNPLIIKVNQIDDIIKNLEKVMDIVYIYDFLFEDRQLITLGGYSEYVYQ